MAARLHVLIVDPSIDSLHDTRCSFEAAHAVVTAVATMTEAVLSLGRHRFHLVVLASRSHESGEASTLLSAATFGWCPIVVARQPRHRLPTRHLLKLGVSEIIAAPIDPDWIRQIDTLTSLPPGVGDAEWDHRLAYVISAVLHRYDEELSSRTLARELGLSPEHLCRLVKRHLGRSLGDLLRARRLRAARSLLSHSDPRVKEIATATGFGSTNALGRAFSAAHGLRPAPWRRAEHSRLAQSALSATTSI